MAGTTLTQRNYPIGDFTTGVNTSILAQEFVDDPTISLTVNTVTQSGSTVICIWNGLMTSGMIVAADAVVAVHAGQDFASPDQDASEESNATDSSNAWVPRVQLVSGPIPSGKYRATCSAELWVGTEGAGNKAQARFRVTNNAFPAGVTVNSGSKDQDASDNWSSVSTLDVVDGEEIIMDLEYRSQNSAVANISAARLFLNRTGDL